MAEENPWNTARLIPTSGINGAEEQERRATSALLAVMSSVKEYGRVLTGRMGAPAGVLETFIEVPFLLGDRKVFPDGLIRVKRGSKVWTALVEVKTGNNELQREQLENYLDVAREHRFDALLTVSNEIPPAAGAHPTAVDKRKSKYVAMHHLSWTEVLTAAVMQKEFRGVADPDQAWILGELIRYLEHPKSGAVEFTDMGQSWVPVRDAVSSGTLRKSDKGAAQVAGRFDALLRYGALKLGQRLGADVTQVLSKAEVANPALRVAAVTDMLVNEGKMSGAIRIPNAVSPLTVTVDIRAAQITCSFSTAAPAEGRPTTRVNWLLRQLKDAPDTLRVEAFAARQRGGTAELLGAARENPGVLIVDPAREIKSFTVTYLGKMGGARLAGRSGFIDSVMDAILTSYDVVGQRLKDWSAAPPRLRKPEEVVVDEQVPKDIPSAALSSQDDELPGPSEAGSP
ncbi:hypothetical protein K0817_015405 [Microbacterium sp. HD4P20]|uniref:hypothetical protein n=1 Tax=Microbacterium sp. HD4P20 TaxID=2864874 RepID=UPI001C63E72B|nr:hypothetical protein [Microbacterium sp. HD4P20]MCP2637938.1 hypothetical protein [Microbacterium sp. HD4P20]